MKVLSREFTGNKEELSRFVREARIAAKLNHPALVRAYDIGQTAEALYIVLEYVEGETLQQLLKRDQRLPVSRTCAIAAKVAEGLAFAAAQGVAHRDIKPANIQLSRHGGVKVLDLGLARPEGDSTLTQPLVVHGTPAYIAPEQARGERKLTPKVDVYALGVVIYRCLSGRHPFAAEQTSELLSKHIHQQAPQLDQVLKGVPEGLSRLVSSMLAKDPAKRPDASVVAVQLRQYVDDASLADIATTATMASRTGKTGAVPFQRFSPMVVLMAAGGLVAALLIVMLIVVSNNKSEQERLRQDLESEQQRASQAGKRAQAAAVQAKKYTETMEKLSDAAQSENPPPVSTGLAGDIERALDNNRALMDDKPE